MDLRLARPDDNEGIRAIYNLEVLESTVTLDLVPRSAADQEQWLVDHSGAHPAVVVTIDDQVVGFGCLSPYRSRPAYSTTVEDSVYVHHGHRGRGIGRALLGELVELATIHGFHSVMARIVAGPESSMGLHRTCGFEMVGVEREVGRKFGRWLDVVLMQRLL